jgi:dihydrofolate reductase
VAVPDGAHPWGYQEDEATKRWKLESSWRAGAQLMGSVTYEQIAAVWPTSGSGYAAPMNEIPKVVFSKSLQAADWSDSRVARGDLPDEIARLKREPGRSDRARRRHLPPSAFAVRVDR